MTKAELLEKLRALQAEAPSEESHMEADGLLLDWIDDPDIREAYVAIRKWYA